MSTRFLVVTIVVAVACVGAASVASVAADSAPVTLADRSRAVRAHRSLAPLPAGTATSSVHDPFGSDSCTECHASNDKAAPGPVADSSSGLCLKCHDDPGMNGDAAFKHLHGGPEGRCLDCHNPHNSAQEHLLHAPISELCASCHVEKTRGAVEHTPITTPESCTKCHLAHGADADHLLNAPYTSKFYEPYKREAYALCFTCHDPKLVEEPRTTTATKFRDGDKNLHTVHVMRDDKGRTCSACHDLHAGAQKSLVHDSVAFGSHGWRLPLAFTQTETGGGCAKSCHMERRYDRARAVRPR